MLQKHQNSPKEFEAQYLLSDQVYMKAAIPPSDKVCLWLGVSNYYCKSSANCKPLSCKVWWSCKTDILI